MISLQYGYLVFSLLFSFYFLVLFYIRPDLQKGMVIMGLVFTVAGLIGQYSIWTVDWWSPQTVTNTRLGIEDIVHGFTIGGVSLVLYLVLFKKKIVPDSKQKKSLYSAVAISIISVGSSLIFFYIFHLHSFLATLLGALIMFFYLIWKRRGLLKISIISGMLLMFVSVPIYVFVNILIPEFIRSSWMHKNLSGITFMNIPIEDIVFYGVVGMIVLPLYLYAGGFSLKDSVGYSKNTESPT